MPPKQSRKRILDDFDPDENFDQQPTDQLVDKPKKRQKVNQEPIRSFQITPQEKEVIISDIIRFMLFKHASKIPIRRRELIDQAVKTTFPGKLPILNAILEEVQSRLKHLFGMMFVPIHKTIPDGENSLLFRIPIDEIGDNKKKVSADTWILKMYEPPKDNLNLNDNQNEEGESQSQSLYHTLNQSNSRDIQFSNDQLEEPKYSNLYQLGPELHEKSNIENFGLLMIILSLLVCSHERLEEVELWNRLSFFGIEKNESHSVFGNTEKVIDDFVKELYLSKVKDENESKEESERKGTNVSIFYYTFGPRIHEDMNPENIVEFLQDITGTKIPDSIQREIQKFRITKDKLLESNSNLDTSMNTTQNMTQKNSVELDEE